MCTTGIPYGHGPYGDICALIEGTDINWGNGPLWAAAPTADLERILFSAATLWPYSRPMRSLPPAVTLEAGTIFAVGD